MINGNVGLRGWALILVLLALAPLSITAPYVLLEPDQPEGLVTFPASLDVQPEGYLLVVLDGVGENIMRDSTMMPKLVERLNEEAVLSITTGPLTLSATCVREMMTGVPNAPIDGLRNFNMEHPGGMDPWLLAADSERYSVGMIGSYVMGNMYGNHPEIEFVNTFEGHADYYEGDEATAELLERWLLESRHNVVAAHFSGPDKVGHKWGTVSDEYRNKMIDMDQQLSSLLRFVPSNWTVVVTADHGMTASGSHGSAEADTRNVLALVSGPGIVPDARAKANQMDLAALMLSELGLDFPAQVNGRVPLSILNLSSQQRDALEAWNWEAALERHLFFHPDDEPIYEVSTVDWEGITSDPVTIRTIDVLISIAVLGSAFSLAYVVLQGRKQPNTREQQQLVILGGIVLASVWFHANLSYSAMIPRAIGAAGVVWLVSSSFGRVPVLDFHRSLVLFKPTPWLLSALALSLFLGDLSRGLLLMLLVWVAFWSITCMTGEAKRNTPSSNLIYSLAVLCSLLLGSLRLWYALIPMFMLLTGVVLDPRSRSLSRQERGSMWTMWALLVLGLSYVHRRIVGTHHLLDLVNITPSSLASILGVVLMFVGFSVMFSIVSKQQALGQSGTACFVVLMVCWVLSLSEWMWLQRTVLAAILGLYGLAWMHRVEKSTRSRFYLHLALGLHLMVSWGPWAAVASLALLMCLPTVVEQINLQREPDIAWSNHPRATVALAMFPWVVWILWWTLLGQVNGVQFCYEGVCPHPRELDPGAVRVQGGYFAGGNQPSTLWMTGMVVSPIVAASVALMYQLLKQGLDLRPYMFAQGLIVFGCLALYAYTPIYPRLVFSLTWNILFAVAQTCFAFVALILFRLNGKSEAWTGLGPSKRWLNHLRFRGYETI